MNEGILPWPEVTNYINNKFNILGTYDLYNFDGRMHLLLHELESFTHYEFGSYEKLVFYHNEVNFYLNSINLQLYNLQLILNYLDIPRSSCILLSSSYGITREVRNLEDQFGVDSTRMKVFESSYCDIAAIFSDKNDSNDFDLIEYPYVCLNGIARAHRIQLLCLFQEYGVFDQGIVSYNFNNDATVDNSNNTTVESPISFLNVIPFQRYNDNVKWNDSINNTYRKWNKKFLNQSYLHKLLPAYKTENNSRIGTYFKKSLLYVVTETAYDYPVRFLTEKTFKAFLNRRPFVIVGPAGSLQELKQLGFKTFDSILDESYDNIVDPSLRLLAIIDIIQKFCHMGIAELQQIAQSVEDIVNYNYNYYLNNFRTKDLYFKLKELNV